MTETEEFEFRLRLEKEKALEQQPDELRNPVTGMRAALGATASLATGAVAAPVSGIAGLFGAAVPGPTGQGANVAAKVGEALTYQPQSPGAQKIAETATAPFRWLSNLAEQAGGAVTDVAGPTAGTAANVAIQAIPAVIGKAAQKPTATALAEKRTQLRAQASRNSVKDATYKAAIDEGYVIPPSEYNPTFIGNRIESIGGKAAIKQQAEIVNQQITNKIARREAGLPDDAPLSEAALETARTQMSKPYAEVAAVSARAAEALEKLKQARSDSKVYWKHYNVSADPSSLAKAKSFDQRAVAYEKVIDAEAMKTGKPGLLVELRQARQNLAKNFTVDRALNVGDGNVDALVIGRMRDKGSPMTGGLKTIGDFANAFPRFARQESKVPAAGVSKSEAIASSLFGAGGFQAFGPYGLAAAGLPLIAPPAARALALSGRRPKSYEPGVGLRMTDALAAGLPSVGLVGMAEEINRRNANKVP